MTDQDDTPIEYAPCPECMAWLGCSAKECKHPGHCVCRGPPCDQCWDVIRRRHIENSRQHRLHFGRHKR